MSMTEAEAERERPAEEGPEEAPLFDRVDDGPLPDAYTNLINALNEARESSGAALRDKLVEGLAGAFDTSTRIFVDHIQGVLLPFLEETRSIAADEASKAIGQATSQANAYADQKTREDKEYVDAQVEMVVEGVKGEIAKANSELEKVLLDLNRQYVAGELKRLTEDTDAKSAAHEERRGAALDQFGERLRAAEETYAQYEKSAKEELKARNNERAEAGRVLEETRQGLTELGSLKVRLQAVEGSSASREDLRLARETVKELESAIGGLRTEQAKALERQETKLREALDNLGGVVNKVVEDRIALSQAGIGEALKAAEARYAEHERTVAEKIESLDANHARVKESAESAVRQLEPLASRLGTLEELSAPREELSSLQAAYDSLAAALEELKAEAATAGGARPTYTPGELLEGPAVRDFLREEAAKLIAEKLDQLELSDRAAEETVRQASPMPEQTQAEEAPEPEEEHAPREAGTREKAKKVTSLGSMLLGGDDIHPP